MTSLVDWFSRVCEEAQRSFITFQNPALDYDTRVVKGWPLVTLDSALYAVAAYLVMVAIGLSQIPAGWKPPAEKPAKGDWLTAFRKEPIRVFQAVYNLSQVVLCLYMVVGTLLVAERQGFRFICNTYKPQDTELPFMLWVFYLSKILDFTDTYIIIHRKNWNQLSFLHVYHHVSVFLSNWMNLNAGFTGDIYFMITANSFIHLVMYYYYLVASFGSSPAWGRYLTMMQMVQFMAMNAQAVYLLYYGCEYPPRLLLTYFLYVLSLLALFAQFYIRKHCSRREGGKKAD